MWIKGIATTYSHTIGFMKQYNHARYWLLNFQNHDLAKGKEEKFNIVQVSSKMLLSDYLVSSKHIFR